MKETRTLSRNVLNILEHGNLSGLITEDLESCLSVLESMMFASASDRERNYYRAIYTRVKGEIADRAMMEQK